MKEHRDVKSKDNRKSIDWKKMMNTASTVAGTVGSAVLLAKSVTGKRKRSKFSRIAKAVKISTAALGIMAGGVKFLNDYMPDTSHQIKRKARRSYRRLKRKFAF